MKTKLAISTIYHNVNGRGYINGTGLTADEIIARQVAKLTEELGEVMKATRPPATLVHTWRSALLDASNKARYSFDDRNAWNGATVDREKLAAELADIVVVAAVCSGLLGIDVFQLAVEKSERDVRRGVR